MATTYTQALLDRATAYVAQPLDKRRYAEGLTEVSQLVSDITGEPNGGCRQCQYLDYLSLVKSYIRAATRFLHPETMSESKYTIVSPYTNEQFVHEGLSEAVTAENLTDETAEYLIGKGFGHAIKLRGEQTAQAEAGTTPTDVVPENPLVPEADLTAEQTAHAATKQALAAEKQQYESLLPKYNEANGARTKAENALKSEKTAHGETKKQLTEAQKQLAEKSAPNTEAAPAASTDGAAS